MENIIQSIPAVVSYVLIIVAVLVVLTNVVTEVVKKIFTSVPSNILALAVAMILALVALFAFCQLMEVAVTWYLVVAAVVVGFLTAYAAMFGYDKLRQLLEQFTQTK